MRNQRVAAAIAAALLATLAPAAWGHEGDSNYRSVVDQVLPATPGIEVEVTNFDDSLRLVNNSGLDIEIEGYEEEPYARILADGTVELNRNSTAYYLNGDRYAESAVPDDLDPNDPPDWEVVDRSSAFSWHDHRMHWMSTALPPQVTDESKETKIFDYSVPIAIDGKAGEIEGTLTWVGTDSGLNPLLISGLAALVVLVAAGSIALRRRRDSATDKGKEAW